MNLSSNSFGTFFILIHLQDCCVSGSDFYILHIFPLTCIILLRRNSNPHISIFQISWQEIEKKKFFFWPKYGLSFPLNSSIWSKSGRLRISWTINSEKFRKMRKIYIMLLNAVAKNNFVKTKCKYIINTFERKCNYFF